MRAAFLDHIRKGRGFVVFHAGSCVFNDWAEFQQVAGATWGKGTSHGARHALPNGLTLYDSYHCSRYNTQTRRLTPAMFEAVFADISNHVRSC